MENSNPEVIVIIVGIVAAIVGLIFIKGIVLGLAFGIQAIVRYITKEKKWKDKKQN